MAIYNPWAFSPLPTYSQDTKAASKLPRLFDILKSKRFRLVSAATITTLLALYVFVRPIATASGWPYGPSVSRWAPSVSAVNGGDVDWSRFAYVQYVTDSAYLCNSVMLFEILHRLGSKADRLLMYPSSFKVADDTAEGRLLREAQTKYGAKLQPIKIQRRPGGISDTWSESYTKLLAFNQTQYSRVLSLDSDSTILQTMDELFLLPPCPVAMPRAYWITDSIVLSSQLVLVTPAADEFARIQNKIETATDKEFDMEIVNELYGNSALIIPHRPYNLLTGEFRHLENHTEYLGRDTETWDAHKALAEAKFLHFSDWPVPKPWINGNSVLEERKPECVGNGEELDCTQRDMWLGFYSDFARRRKTGGVVMPDTSQDNGLCLNSFDGKPLYWRRRSCTDPTCRSPNCLANLCAIDGDAGVDGSAASQNVAVTECSDGSLCRGGGNKNYCNNGSGTRIAAAVG
ncbi:hypothetical protein V498_08086 [Pseudogymnoascus sp. VKM F-4517 (FW-2822)]|nr:hypothetical protein V498_08086 [Pseudogymnoascus sp. VKM F-4517 (FW-2822)]